MTFKTETFPPETIERLRDGRRAFLIHEAGYKDGRKFVREAKAEDYRAIRWFVRSDLNCWAWADMQDVLRNERGHGLNGVLSKCSSVDNANEYWEGFRWGVLDQWTPIADRVEAP